MMRYGGLVRRSRRGQGVLIKQTTTASAIRREPPNNSSFSFFTWYSHKLDTHPITTKCVSAGLISSTGNILAQHISHYKEDDTPEKQDFGIEWDQVGRFAFLNVAFVAPVLHYWYQFINKAVPGTSTARVLQRTFWDEFVFTPLYIPVFLGSLWSLEGTPPEKTKRMLMNELPGIIVAEWMIWVPTMFITFKYIPVKFQALVINAMGVGWQTFLSFMASQAHGNAIEEDDEESHHHHPTHVSVLLEKEDGDGRAHVSLVLDEDAPHSPFPSAHRSTGKEHHKDQRVVVDDGKEGAGINKGEP